MTLYQQVGFGLAAPLFTTRQQERQHPHTGVSKDAEGENVQVVDDVRLGPTLSLVTPF